jgi:hypothetical protein
MAGGTTHYLLHSFKGMISEKKHSGKFKEQRPGQK